MMQRLWSKKPVRLSIFVSWTVFVFLVSLVWTYPSDALVAEIEAAVSKGVKLKHFEVTSAGLSGLGVALKGVEVVTAKGDAKLPWKMDRLWVGLKGFRFDPQKPALRFAVDAYEGSVSGLYNDGELQLEVDDLNLARAMPMQKIVRVGLGGQLEGSVQAKLSPKGLRKLNGEIDLTLVDAFVGPGEVPIPGFGSDLSFPKATVGTIPLDITIRKGELELKSFKVTGGDVELAGEGTLKFMSRLNASRFDMAFDVHATKKLNSTQEGKNLLTALDPKSPLLPSRIKRSFSKKGWLGVSLEGRLARPRIKVRKSRVQ